MTPRLPTISLRALAAILISFGIGAIWLGWFGAAGYDWLPAQLPYLISGGLAGLGLVIAGSTLFVVDVVQRAAAARAAELMELRRELAQLLRAPRSDGGVVGRDSIADSEAAPERQASS